MGCVRASGAPGSSRRQPEMTRKVFRELNVASKQHKKLEILAQYFISRAGFEYHGYNADENGFH